MFDSSQTVDTDFELKERVRAFWQAHPCGTKFSDAEIGTREFFARIEAHRYAKEWHIPEAADFAGARGLRVLEIGCGLGTDGEIGGLRDMPLLRIAMRSEEHTSELQSLAYLV